MASRSVESPGLRTSAHFSDPLFAGYRVLIVGISRYRDTQISPIRNADRDARVLREALVSIGYARERITCLCNEKATRAAVRRQLVQLDRMSNVRFLLIFWAGHGIADEYHRSFLLPYNAELRRVTDTAIAVDQLMLLTRVANALHKAVFLDTCFAEPRVRLPEWDRLGIVPIDPSLAFVGASTYLALSQAGTGGVLASCLREALTDDGNTLCDQQGRVTLDDVILHLQRYVRPRAGEAWKRAGMVGEGPQRPHIVFQAGAPVTVGRNVGTHLRSVVEQATLSEPARKLAMMFIDREWPQGNGR